MKLKKIWILSVALLSLLIFSACSNSQEMKPEDEPTNIEMTPEEQTESEITPEEEQPSGDEETGESSN